MVAGVGTDLVDVRRISKMQQRFAGRFVERVLVPTEREIWQAQAQPEAYLAKRWAAKEAVAKALGTGIGGHVSFQDIEISNAPSGQPQVTLQGGALARLTALGAQHCWLSLSDEGDYALAFVVLV